MRGSEMFTFQKVWRALFSLTSVLTFALLLYFRRNAVGWCQVCDNVSSQNECKLKTETED